MCCASSRARRAWTCPDYAAQTGQLARTIPPHEALKRLAALEEMRENLGRNIKEDLAIEAGFLRAFGD